MDNSANKPLDKGVTEFNSPYVTSMLDRLISICFQLLINRNISHIL